jgi:hypothetical protein
MAPNMKRVVVLGFPKQAQFSTPVFAQTYHLDQEWIWDVQRMHMGGAEGAVGASKAHNFEVKDPRIPRAHRGRSQMSPERRPVA